MKIYSLGSLNIDYVYSVGHFVSPGETLASDKLSVVAGGKGLNQSIAAARAGAMVLHGARLGAEGDFLLNTLSESGVDTSRIEKIGEKCGHAIIQVNSEGENCILLYGGSNKQITAEYVEAFLSDAAENDVLLLQNEINALDVVFEAAHKKKMQIAFNPSPYNDDILQLPLSYVKWWFCNEIEGHALFGGETPEQICNSFKAKYPNADLVLTLGSKGSLFYNAEKLLRQPIFKVKAVDTTAAGDTFCGYFLAELLRSGDEAKALKIAAKASAIAVTKKGASVSIPTLKEVNSTAIKTN